MAKAELGTKRVCPTTGRKFYDLNKDPVISPYTGEIVPIVVLPVSRRSAPVAAPVAPLAPEVEAPETAEVELVPLEEADAEAEGGKKEAIAEGEEEEAEVADAGAEDDTFLETDEEGDDVSDIVGGEREDEEDT